MFELYKYKISILVPIYGVERYIERCARSLFEQTYENIEYIFVNDCTKDKSIEILNETIKCYPHRISQIKIVSHKINRGLAAARNTAVENATGEFILHVDSDDYIENNAVTILINEYERTKCDIVVGNLYKCFVKKKIPYKNQLLDKDVYIKQIFLDSECNHWIWGKLIKRSLYIDNDVKVKEGCNMGEDFQVFPQLLYYSKSISYVDDFIYNYECCNLSSYCKNSKNNDIYRFQILESYKILESFFCKTDYENCLNIYKLRMLARSFRYCILCNLSKKYYQTLILEYRSSDLSLLTKLSLIDIIILKIRSLIAIKYLFKL